MSLIKIPIVKEVRKFLIIFYIIALSGFMVPVTSDLFKKIIPLALLVNIFLLINFHQKWNVKFIVLSLFILLSGFFIEVIGVNKGFPFGNYFYGETLYPKLFKTPLIIGINWIMLVYCTYIIIEKLKIAFLLKTVLGAMIMVLFDLIMEPVAVYLDMWQWLGNVIPLSNYISWFIISFLFVFIFQIFRIKIKNEIAIHIFILQFVFFIVLLLYIFMFKPE